MKLLGYLNFYTQIISLLVFFIGAFIATDAAALFADDSEFEVGVVILLFNLFCIGGYQFIYALVSVWLYYKNSLFLRYIVLVVASFVIWLFSHWAEENIDLAGQMFSYIDQNMFLAVVSKAIVPVSLLLYFYWITFTYKNPYKKLNKTTP